MSDDEWEELDAVSGLRPKLDIEREAFFTQKRVIYNVYSFA